VRITLRPHRRILVTFVEFNGGEVVVIGGDPESLPFAGVVAQLECLGRVLTRQCRGEYLTVSAS